LPYDLSSTAIAKQMVALATRLAVPAICHQREFAPDGGH